jgi:FMN phosphatase YigB (HAD superfamily)
MTHIRVVWLEGIPRLYAVKHGISLDDAKTHVSKEYEKVGRERLEWYDLTYWTEKFGLDVCPEEILSSFQHRIRVFPEVTEILQEFKDKGFRPIIMTNARREFLNLELERTKIGHYFERVFSSTSDFNLIKKTVNLYRKVCNIIGVSPSKMAHVGDDWFFDFAVPKKLGIKAFYLDRTGETSGNLVIHNLKELGARVTRE